MQKREGGVLAYVVLITLGVVSYARATDPPAPAIGNTRILLTAGRGAEPFDVTTHAVRLEDIIPGGPPRDGIPALDSPQFVDAREAGRFLNSGDSVLGVEHNGVAKAYPISIMNWHEIVNDDFAGSPVLVTW